MSEPDKHEPPKVEFWRAGEGRGVYVRPPGHKRGHFAESFEKATHLALEHLSPPFEIVFVNPATLTKDDYPITRKRKESP